MPTMWDMQRWPDSQTSNNSLFSYHARFFNWAFTRFQRPQKMRGCEMLAKGSKILFFRLCLRAWHRGWHDTNWPCKKDKYTLCILWSWNITWCQKMPSLRWVSRSKVQVEMSAGTTKTFPKGFLHPLLPWGITKNHHKRIHLDWDNLVVLHDHPLIDILNMAR